MARSCELTGKAVMVGNTVSNANNRNRTRFFPNLTSKRLFVPELNQFVSLKISKRGLRIIDKLGGLLPACRRYEKTISPRLKQILKRAS
jgi:large subunit ribosomal protein L28